MLPAILSVLEEDVTRAAAPNATKPVRDKGADAAEMRGRLYNETSLLRLAGTVDIYEVFGNLVNAAQQFRLLPHQRLDRVRGILEDWTRMTEHIEDSACLASGSSWFQVSSLITQYAFFPKATSVWDKRTIQNKSFREIPLLLQR